MVLAAPRWRRSGPEVVGRREELAALEDELSRAAAGAFRLVLLLGDPRVGKSRLARELVDRHQCRPGRRRPLVVVLDDVHHADASSWQALRYFARHLDDSRLLVLATSRPAELAQHDVAAQVLFELDQDALLSRLPVNPLDRADGSCAREPTPASVP